MVKAVGTSFRGENKKPQKNSNHSKFESTYGSFKLIGEVVGIGKDNARNDGTSDKSGRDWVSLRFGVKTAPDSVTYVELMGVEMDTFTIKSAKTGEKESVPFEDRFDDLPEGYYMVGVNMALEREDTGKKNKDGSQKTKQKKVTMQAFDAIDYILENVGDGESVYVSGNIRYSVYENPETNEKRLQKQFQINFISKQAEEIDFEDEEFEETSKFEQTIVITGTEKDSKEKSKVYVHAMILNVNGQTGAVTTVPTQFTIIEDGGTKKLAAKIRSFKYGTVLKVTGDIINRYEETEDSGNDADEWGDQSKGYRKGAAKAKIAEMRIQAAEPQTLNEGYYNEEDFLNEAAETFGNKGDEWGNQSRSKTKGNEEDEDDDDGLPF